MLSEVLSKLVGLDQKYLVIEKEYDAEVTKLLAQYEQKSAAHRINQATRILRFEFFLQWRSGCVQWGQG